MKKYIGGLLSGLILWGALLFSVDLISEQDIFHRTNWRSLWLWGSFFIGFATAYWLRLWFFLWRHVGHSSKKPTPNTVSTTPSPTPSNVTTAPKSMPMAMPVQTKAVMSVVPTPGTGAAPTTIPAATNLSSTPVAPATKPVSMKGQDINNLSKLGSNLDMMAFKHVALQGKVLDLVYSSDDVAVLCKVLSDDTTWTVDISQPIDTCVWTASSGVSMTPGADLFEQKQILQKMESDARVLPTIVLVRGSIPNYREVQEYLSQSGVYLVKPESDGEPGVKTLEELLNANFLTFPANNSNQQEESNEQKDNQAIEAPTEQNFTAQTEQGANTFASPIADQGAPTDPTAFGSTEI